MKTKNNNKPIPPIIENWISELNNEKLNIYVRDNYKTMLENVRDSCAEAVQKYYADRHNHRNRA